MVTILPAEWPTGGLVGVREDRSRGGGTGNVEIACGSCRGGLRVGEDRAMGFSVVGFGCCWRGICSVGPHRHHVYGMTGRRIQPTRLAALSFPRPSWVRRAADRSPDVTSQCSRRRPRRKCQGPASFVGTLTAPRSTSAGPGRRTTSGRRSREDRSSLPKLAAEVEERRKDALTRIEQADKALAEPFKHAAALKAARVETARID
jgi:hypothetical protein